MEHHKCYYFSVPRALSIRGIKLDNNVNNTYGLYILVVRRFETSTSGGTVVTTASSPAVLVPLTLDPVPTPLFTASYSQTGALTPGAMGVSDKEVFLHASNPVGATEFEDGDITALNLAANDKGSLDIYVAGGCISGPFVMTVFVTEN